MILPKSRPFLVFVVVCAGGLQAQPIDRPDNVTLGRLYQELDDRHGTLLDQQATTRTRLAELEALLARYTIDEETIEAANRISEEELAELRRLIEELRAEIAAKAAELEIDPENIPEELLQDRAELLLLEEEIKRLNLILATMQDDETPLTSAVALRDRQSVPFMLTGGNIAPFATPYFDYTLIRVRLADRSVVERRRYHRASDAGPVSAAVLPGGVLYELVHGDKFDPANAYITLWVCADSIDAFYSVVAFCQENNLTYNWSPDVDEPWIANEDDAPVEAWGYQNG